jgi:hypothetical protein
MTDETVTFQVTKWTASKDDNGRNIHAYLYTKLQACDPCFEAIPGKVDDLYIISCQRVSECFSGTALATEKTEICLQKTP